MSPKEAAKRKGSPPPGGKRRPEHEIEARMKIIRNAMALGASKDEIHAALDKEGMTLPQRTLDQYMHNVRAEWDAQVKEEWPTRRARQLRRLHGQVQYLMSKGRVKDVAPIERLIAQIEGNLAPIVIDDSRRQGWDDLSDEQIAFVKEHGLPPPGVSAEDLDQIH